MVSRNVLRLSFAAFAALAYANPYPRAATLSWSPCNGTEVPGQVPAECSTLEVPLDYTEPGETHVLDLVRVPAPIQPSKGSIILNFGGPGGTGRDVVVQLATVLQALSGRQYDLLSFDPRGTSGSRLQFNCLDNDFDGLSLVLGLSPANESEGSLGRIWAQGTITADTCLRTQNKTGSLISTAFTARDIMQIVDALQEDGMLRYWGFSYGTTLGATIAAMFPDRVERMVLDGVQNPHQYYRQQVEPEARTDADAAFSAIFTGCVAAPNKCALARDNRTAAELEREVLDFFEAVKLRPLVVQGAILDYTAIKSYFVGSLYDSSGWPALSGLVDTILTGQYESSSGVPTDPTPIRQTIILVQALAGIRCSDSEVRTETFEDFALAVQSMYESSNIMGDMLSVYATCSQWKIEPKERYTGDFNVDTKNPVLFIGNTFDGLTPLVSAKNVSSTFKGSAVLEVNGYGHSSLVIPSTCSLNKTSTYWLGGTLPEKDDLFCESDAPLYSGVTWEEIIDKYYGANSTTRSKRTPFKRSIPVSPKIGYPIVPHPVNLPW
ncbi:alpha/beta-hydrolase [Durotheca rogersii]|uniref:alpha/beta-hydrolase n=1 Tax=Durotheca rogersii TaxID=419775 RepID=UPI00222052A4|nr:alpha/beta-hydrolase [Durotheca rogersii]KAI5868113.1 alpha/beta-hydrolase [Durotheca rogersii]